MLHLRVVTALFAALCSAAFGQSIPGEFQPPDERWISPANGTTGVAYSGGAPITIDRNGNGIVGAAAGDAADPVYTLPSEAQNGLNYFLSPLRTFLYTTKSGTPCGSGVLGLRIYRLPFPVAAPVLIHQDCVPCGLFNGTPDFYETGLVEHAPLATGVSPRRLMLAVTRNSQTTCAFPTALLALRVYDLDVPGVAGRGMAVLQEGWQSLRIAQSGNFAFIQHDLTNNPADSDGSLIDLCPGPTFGQIIHTVDNVSGDIRANISAVGSGNLTVNITDDGVAGYTNTRADCLASPLAPLGSCCVSGICSQTIQADCTGTWTPMVSCNTLPCGPPPAPNLVLTASAPATIGENREFNYTFTATNTGDLPAENVNVFFSVPSGGTFVSVSAPGTNSSGLVSWFLGTLAPGQSVPLTCRVLAQCNPTSLTMNTATIQGGHRLSWPTPPAVMTAVTSQFRGPVGVAVTSVPSRVPMQPGDTILHTITLTEGAGVARASLMLNAGAINVGESCTLTTVVDPGTGVVTPQGTSAFRWTGPLGAGQSTSIVILATVGECISPFNSGVQLGGSNEIQTRNECGFTVGSSVTPGPFPLRAPIDTSMSLTNLTPGLVGTPSQGDSIFPDTIFQPVRQGAAIKLELVLSNVLNVDEPSVTVSIVVPPGIIVANPPFPAPPPAGVIWNDLTRTVSYTGPIMAGQTVVVSIVGSLPPGTGCSDAVGITASGTTAPSCSDIRAGMSIVPIAEVPAGPFEVFLNESQGLRVLDEAANPITYQTVCMPSETWFGLAHGPGTELWLCGLPIVRIDLVTLDFAIMPSSVQDSVNAVGGAANFVHVRDAAVEASTGHMILYGRSNNGLEGHLFRLDRSTNAVTHLMSDPAFAAADDIVCLADGSVLVPTGGTLRRVWFVGSLPLPAGSGATLTIPMPTNMFGGTSGARQSDAFSRIATLADGSLFASVKSVFRRDEGAPGAPPYVLTEVQSILSVDPDALSSTILIDHASAFTARVPSGFVPPAPEIGALAVRLFSDSAFVPVDGTHFRFGSNLFSRAITEVVTFPESLRDVLPSSGFGPLSTDLLHFDGAAGCPGDWDGDGDDDSDDIIAFFLDWDAGNGDVDGDQDTDSDDVVDFFVHWDAGC